MDFYMHYIGDWAKHTQHLSLTESGIYHRLIEVYYMLEKPLPGVVLEVSRLIGAQTRAERAALARVLGDFFTLEADGCFHQDRCDAELATYASKKRAGELGAAKRWNGVNALKTAKKALRASSELLEQPKTSRLHPYDRTMNGLDDPSKRFTENVPNMSLQTRNSDPINVNVKDKTTQAEYPAVDAYGLQSVQNTDGSPIGSPITTPDAELEAELNSLSSEQFVTHGAQAAGVQARAEKAGLKIHRGDPVLVALVTAGTTDDEFDAGIARAVAGGKSGAWMLAAVAGRRQDARQGVQAGAGSTQTPSPMSGYYLPKNNRS